MPVYDFEIATVSQVLEKDTVLTQALLFPERVFYGDTRKQAGVFAKNYARSLIQTVPSIEGHRYQLAGVREVSEMMLELEPAHKSPAWVEPVGLTFHVVKLVKWTHGDETAVAYVPALDITVLGEKPENFDDLVRSHIKFALLRKKAANSLWQLSQLQRTRDLMVEWMRFQDSSASVPWSMFLPRRLRVIKRTPC